ncbi:hypothetical protein EPN87_00910 [archaeon]|nr:MAG: hypothetical protein EPN87_00910 [archaeon]
MVERIIREVITFRNAFKKHLTEFITGAFSFVAALLWRDAIQGSLDSLQGALPNIGLVPMQYFTAIIITIVAVIAIVAISRVLKVEQ